MFLGLVREGLGSRLWAAKSANQAKNWNPKPAKMLPISGSKAVARAKKLICIKLLEHCNLCDRELCNNLQLIVHRSDRLTY
jgi:hypothetical protein